MMRNRVKLAGIAGREDTAVEKARGSITAYLTCGMIAAFVLVLVLGASIRVVDPGEACAVVRLGSLVGTLGPGFHFVTPVVTSLKCYSVRTVIYETSDQPDESQADFTDFTVDANTSDGQQIKVTFGVGFHVDPPEVEYVYGNIGRNMTELVERVVKYEARSVVRKTAQDFEASALYTGSIYQFESKIAEQLRTLFADRHVMFDSIVVRKIDFDDMYEAAIEQQQIAKENIETANFQAQSAEFEADRTAVLARGLAEARVEQAKGDAEAVRVAAQAEAEAIRLRGEALEAYPLVLQLNFIQQLSEANWMMLPSEGLTPLIPIQPNP